MADVSPWVEFGLAGLFGVYAIVLMRMVFAHLGSQSDQWRERLGSLDDSIKELNNTIQKMNDKNDAST